MSALSAAKLGVDRAAPRVNTLLMAVTVALVFFIDALLRLKQAKPGMPDKTGLLSQLLRVGVAMGRRRGGTARPVQVAIRYSECHVFACRMGVQHLLDVRMVQDRLDGKAALICGSVAYDTILQFQDRFKSHILPDKIHILNVSFLVPDMRRDFAGCAANIAYSLKLLGDRGVPMATAGHDFAPYATPMAAHALPADHIKVVDDTFTAQAFITTDLPDNQITACH